MIFDLIVDEKLRKLIGECEDAGGKNTLKIVYHDRGIIVLSFFNSETVNTKKMDGDVDDFVVDIGVIKIIQANYGFNAGETVAYLEGVKDTLYYNNIGFKDIDYRKLDDYHLVAIWDLGMYCLIGLVKL